MEISCCRPGSALGRLLPFSTVMSASLIYPELRHAPLESQPNRRCPRLSTERTDTEHFCRLLRACRERPRRRAAERG